MSLYGLTVMLDTGDVAIMDVLFTTRDRALAFIPYVKGMFLTKFGLKEEAFDSIVTDISVKEYRLIDPEY